MFDLAQFAPLSEAALLRKTTGDKLRRLVQSGAVRGTLHDGRWFVDRAELPPAPTSIHEQLADSVITATSPLSGAR